MKFKKYLPFIIFGLGLVILAGVLAWVFLRPKTEDVPEEEPVAEIPFEKRPFTTLTPTEDGHYLMMRIENIGIDAESLDYELLYEVPDKPPQGVPGTVKLTEDVIERELLLGSESSGKFRYDEGVEWGTLTLRFRDGKGKLVGKVATSFHLQSGTSELTDKEGIFKYTLTKENEGYFVTMNTIGMPKQFASVISKGPFGIFGSVEEELPGEVSLEGDVYYLDTDWIKLDDKNAPDIGVFITSSPSN